HFRTQAFFRNFKRKPGPRAVFKKHVGDKTILEHRFHFFLHAFPIGCPVENRLDLRTAHPLQSEQMAVAFDICLAHSSSSPSRDRLMYTASTESTSDNRTSICSLREDGTFLPT